MCSKGTSIPPRHPHTQKLTAYGTLKSVLHHWVVCPAVWVRRWVYGSLLRAGLSLGLLCYLLCWVLSLCRAGGDRKPEQSCPARQITRQTGAGPQATAPPPQRPLVRVNKFHPIRSVLLRRTWHLITLRIKR